MNIGIVGHEAKKFIPLTEQMAKELIRQLLEPANSVLVSGHCHLGGIDIWAEEIATLLGKPKLIYAPEHHSWDRGYKPRNIKIAENSNVVHSIVVAKYPPTYEGMRFEDAVTGEPYCYHCNNNTHVKSGGCWTAKYAKSLGKQGFIHVLETENG